MGLPTAISCNVPKSNIALLTSLRQQNKLGINEMNKPPLIPCSECSGKGQIELTPPLWKNLKAIKELKNPTNRQIHTFLQEPIHITAVFRRTEKLVKHGLVAMALHKGKEATYSLVK